MVSFLPSEEEKAFVDVAKNFAIQKIRPYARQTEKNQRVSEDVVRKLSDLGLLNLELSESYGGLELPLVSQVQIVEALAYGDLDTIQGLPGAGEGASFIRLKEDHNAFSFYQTQCETGICPTVAFVYPSQHKLQIKKIDNGYIIDGETSPLKNARKAEYLLIAGTATNGEAVLLWIDQENNHSWKVLDGDYRLGLLSAGFSRILLKEVNVFNNNILASGIDAETWMNEALSRVRTLEAAKEIGVMAAALDYTVEYTSQRKAFGVEIAKFQGVSFNLAQMAIQTGAARHLVLYAAKQIDEGESDAIYHSIQALNKAHQSLRYVTDSAVQLLGGHGYVQDHPVEKWMRDAQAQVGWFEQEGDLEIRAGNWIMYGKERGMSNDHIRVDATSRSS